MQRTCRTNSRTTEASASASGRTAAGSLCISMSLSSAGPVGDGGIVPPAVRLASSVLLAWPILRAGRRGTGVLEGGGVCGEWRCVFETFQRQVVQRGWCRRESPRSEVAAYRW